jgi:hypothetical protein
MGGSEAWQKGKVNVCQRCDGVTAVYIPPEPEPEPPPLMRVRKTGMSNTRKVTPYRDPDGALKDTVTSVDTERVVRVPELIDWCEANPDIPAQDLAASLAKGEFG